MPKDFDTKAALIKAGTQEFLEHGFQGASLRTICARACVTTGAFYTHFKKKEDLFCAIVEDDLAAYFDKYNSLMERLTADMVQAEDNEVEIVEYLLERRDLFRLLFDCSAGTKYESFKVDLIRHFENTYQKYFDAFAATPVDHDITRLVVKMKFAQYMELLYGNYSREHVRKIMERMQEFTRAGFEALTGSKMTRPV